MKVLIVADVLGSENNGTTVACMNLVRYLRKTGNEVRIICCDEDKKGIENYYVVPTINFGILNGIVKKNEVTLAKVDKKILSNAIEGVDIVHIMIPFALGKAALKMAMKLGIPVTAGFHCQAENFSCHLGLMNSKIANKLIYKNFYNRFYKYVNAIHYPTNFIKNTFERAIKKETNAYVISNGVNDRFVRKKVEKPDNLRDKFVILSIGRYSQEKSHKILIKAVSLSKYKNNIKLIFAGSGPRKEELIKYIKKCKIDMPIMKFYDRDELVNVINYSDLYCHPAEVELEGIACLEAITTGLVPVVNCSKRAATKEFAIDRNCCFKFNDSNDLKNKIDFWIENKELKEEYSDKYLSKVSIYRQDDCMEKMLNMMKDVINNAKNNILS